MFKRSRWLGLVAFALAPMASAYASADCKADPLSAPLTAFSVDSLLSAVTTAEADESVSSPGLNAAPFQFRLMSPLMTEAGNWQMPAGRYWFSVQVNEAQLSQEGIGVAPEDVESWLLAPADSLAVPF